MLLFVYGTLQPGHGRWEAISGLADPLGAATARGRLWATPWGWPAAVFDAEAGEVHGTLLRALPAAARRLREVTDEIEGEGDLFVRVTVPVAGPGGEVEAEAYAWNRTRGEPPGRPLPGGRWAP